MKKLLIAIAGYVSSIIEKLPATGHNVPETGRTDQTTTTLTQTDLEVDCVDVHDLENFTPH